ncbi:hypothetical protein [Alistipes sp.]|uniref:hypothetical protein n=1 Tax=Alistipes sp. TaxID=1872444 RepID=UPI0025BA161F|nr:hypothetical protein [Alistipes sp.]
MAEISTEAAFWGEVAANSNGKIWRPGTSGQTRVPMSGKTAQKVENPPEKSETRK